MSRNPVDRNHVRSLHPHSTHKGHASWRRRLSLEPLEDRQMLAVVTLNTDTGAVGELRSTISAAASGETIEFMLASGNEMITLTQGELVINKNLTIRGTNQLGSGVPVTLNGNDQSRVMQVDDGNGTINTMTVNLLDITITGGRATDGGAIANQEILNLNSVNIAANRAIQPNVSMNAKGGGIFNAGMLTLTDSQVVQNTAEFAAGGGNRAFGGGIASSGIGSTLTIRDSAVTDNESVGGSGGGIFLQMGALSISASTISGNRAGLDTSVHGAIQQYDSGGGIAAVSEGPDSTFAPFDIDIRDSYISDNQTSNDALTGTVFPYGGGLYARGRGTVNVVSTCITGNSVTGNTTGTYSVRGRGGGMFFYGDDGGDLAVTISTSHIANNQAIFDGGAIGTEGRHTTDGNSLDDGTVHLTISGSTISDNSAGHAAGAIFNRAFYSDQAETSLIRIMSSTISGNSVAAGQAGGGAIVNRSGGAVEISDSTLSGNSAYYGGALYQYATGLLPTPPDPASGIPRITVRNSTLSGNMAETNGGAVYSYDGTLEIIQSTISQNTALNGYGGGIYLNTYAPWVNTPAETFSTIDRSTITLNSGFFGGGIATDYYHSSTWSNSVISGNTADPGTEDLYLQSNSNIVQSFNYIGGNAQLGPLTTNGGFTLTHLPEAGSPLINAADPAAVGTADQRGYEQRISGGQMDIGAVEVGAQAACDRDGDGDCDVNDIDALMVLISLGSATLADRDSWLAAAGAENLPCGLPYLVGDFNLDGVTDGQDFIIWNGNKFTSNTQWSAGNANGDSVVDGADFINWNTNKFSASCGSAECNPAQRVTSPADTHMGTPEAKSRLRDRKNRSDEDGLDGGRKQIVVETEPARAIAFALYALNAETFMPSLQTDKVSITLNADVSTSSRVATAVLTTASPRDKIAEYHRRTCDDKTTDKDPHALDRFEWLGI